MIKFLPGKRGVPRIIALAWLYRSAALLWLLTISATAFGYCTETNEWTEDALLHTGKILKINREVCHTLQIFSGDGGSPGFLKSWPDKYWLKFRHPDTQETIKWQGEQYFSPVLLDFVDGIPYLVVHGQPDKETEKIYGCPELPYIFLKYESGIFGKWKVIPVEQFPLVLQDANLSPNPDLPSMSQDMCRDYGGKSCGIFSRDDVLWNIHKVEQSSGGGFQAKIPRGYDTWYSDYKNSHKNERRRNDCRPPRPPPAKVELPPPQEVDLEILDTKDHSPEQVMGQEEWTKLVFDKERYANCNVLFKPADLEDRWMGERFAKDLTGQNKVPYVGYRFGDLSAKRICDKDSILFIAHLEEPNKTVISKYSATGDLHYRIKFQNPEDVAGYRGYIKDPALKSENGYLYFEWHHFREISRMWHVKRTLSVRFREPKSAALSAGIQQEKPQALNIEKIIPLSAQAPGMAEAKSFRDCQTCPEMIAIPGKNFAIGKYEVTQAEWRAVMGVSPHDDREGLTVGEDMPSYKGWHMANDYVSRLSEITGKQYRLPTEAEWEYACYGGIQTDYCGSNDIEQVGWHNGNSKRLPHPVGKKQANAYGLYDMSGNVWEWVTGCPMNNCELRALRGGSYLKHPLKVQAAYIYGISPFDFTFGFRVAGTLDENLSGLLPVDTTSKKREQNPAPRAIFAP